MELYLDSADVNEIDQAFAPFSAKTLLRSLTWLPLSIAFDSCVGIVFSLGIMGHVTVDDRTVYPVHL